MDDQIGIAIFAKAPIEGLAKTRLVPRLGAKGAADLQQQLIARAVTAALASKLGPITLWCTPDCEHPAFASFSARHSVMLRLQTGDDLGTRMLNTFRALTASHPIVIIGTDCPMLSPSHLRACANSLRNGADAVFLPAEDGGYALVGSARPLSNLFLNMPWGTDCVMAETRLRAQQMKLKISEPAQVWDIDTPADYDRALVLGLVPAA